MTSSEAARLDFTAKLLTDLAGFAPASELQSAAVLTEAIGHQIDRLLDEARAAGFREGVAAAQAAAYPDAQLEALRARQDANLQGMLEAFAQMRAVVNH
jgi:hypothetical protein